LAHKYYNKSLGKEVAKSYKYNKGIDLGILNLKVITQGFTTAK